MIGWKSSEWNVICDRCGTKTKSGLVKQDWQGFIVCHNCYESRHPQDFVLPKQDKITVPFIRARPEDLYLDTCTISSLNCYPSIAIAGCAISGKQQFHPEELITFLCGERFAMSGSAIATCAIAGKINKGYF